MECVIRTFTGREVDPLNLRQEDINIEDIAHALALCNRFAGHTAHPISVAQHSVYVSRLAEEEPFQGLLHDASEAYLGDVTKWLKRMPAMAGYREAEERAQNTIYQAFGCSIHTHPSVENADRIMVRYEGRLGLGPAFAIRQPGYPPLTDEEIAAIGAWGFISWKKAEQMFLDRFQELSCNGV